MFAKLSNYVRFGCENTHISAVRLGHRAAVDGGIPAGFVHVWQEAVRVLGTHVSGYQLVWHILQHNFTLDSDKRERVTVILTWCK